MLLYLSCLVLCRSLHVVPVVVDATVQTSGWPLRLDLSVRSIRCLELSPGCCPLEAPWQTFDQKGFVFSTRTDRESG